MTALALCTFVLAFGTLCMALGAHAAIDTLEREQAELRARLEQLQDRY